MFAEPPKRKPKPYVAGLVRGQLPRSPLRTACKVEIGLDPAQPSKPVLEYSTREETPNERSKRMLAKAMARIKLNKAVIEFTPEEWSRII